jgi:hypothetical protein
MFSLPIAPGHPKVAVEIARHILYPSVIHLRSHAASLTLQLSSSLLILSLTSRSPPTLLTLPGLAGPPSALPGLLDGDPCPAPIADIVDEISVPGEGGHAATARGISIHSCLATVLRVRKNGQSLVNIWSEVWASAVEMGVLDDLTITSAASDIGIALRRPRGGVGSVLGPGDGAENILASQMVSMEEVEGSHCSGLIALTSTRPRRRFRVDSGCCVA